MGRLLLLSRTARYRFGNLHIRQGEGLGKKKGSAFVREGLAERLVLLGEQRFLVGVVFYSVRTSLGARRTCPGPADWFQGADRTVCCFSILIFLL